MKKKKPIVEALELANRKALNVHAELVKDLDKMESVYHAANTNRIISTIQSLIDLVKSHSEKSARRRTETLNALRKYDLAADACASAYRRLVYAIDGRPIDILARGDQGITGDDDFLGMVYDAIAQNSIRKWTRKHLEIIKKAVEERNSLLRKIDKLSKMANGDTPEAKTAAAKKREFADAIIALSKRIDFIVRKFLQLRHLALKTLVGTTESIYTALGGCLPVDTVRRYGMTDAIGELEAIDKKAMSRRCK